MERDATDTLSIGFCCVYCHNIMMMYFGMNQDGMYFGPVSWHVLSCHGKLTFKFLLGPVVPAEAFKFKSLNRPCVFTAQRREPCDSDSEEELHGTVLPA